MTRHTTTILVAGFMAFLAILVPVIAAEPQPKAGNDDAAQLKAAQEERIKLLSDLEKQLEQGDVARNSSFVFPCCRRQGLVQRPVGLLRRAIEEGRRAGEMS